MSKFLLIPLLAAVAFVPTVLADWHEFTSADGKKKVWAEVQGYESKSGTVTLRLKDNRRISTAKTAFSETDQAYIEKAAVALEAGRNLWIEFADIEKEISEKKNPTNGYQTRKLENGFDIKLRNNGQAKFEGLTAEYQVFYRVYENPFADSAKKTEKVKMGKAEIPAMTPREEAKVTTDPVAMTTIKRLPLSQCTGGT